MAKPRRKGGPKQKLSPGARARKAERDLCYAKGWVWNKESGTCSKSGKGTSTSSLQRKDKKAESQRINCPDGQDYDHNTVLVYSIYLLENAYFYKFSSIYLYSVTIAYYYLI